MRAGRSGAVRVAGVAVVAAVVAGAGVHLASAAEDPAAGTAGAVTVSCPDVAGRLGDVPAAAQAGVRQELDNLTRQIAAVDARLAREPQAAQNQLADLAGKRRAVLDRIRLNITRVGGTAPAGLDALAACTLSGADAGAADDPAAGQNAEDQNAEDQNAEDQGADEQGADEQGGGTGASTVDCPSVADRLPAVPARARAEVDRNLALLDQQIAEADARLARLAARPEGGPDFVDNAILGPLADKRTATLNRIATAIGRDGQRPAGLDALAECTLA